MSTNRGPIVKRKARPIEPDLRRAIGAGWANYLLRLSKGMDDPAALLELDRMAAALDELRDATAARLGVI
jgi:hypothetical protein